MKKKAKVKAQAPICAAAGAAYVKVSQLELPHILSDRLLECRAKSLGDLSNLQYAVNLASVPISGKDLIKQINACAHTHLAPTATVASLTDVQQMQYQYYRAIFSDDPKQQLNYAEKAFAASIDILSHKAKPQQTSDRSLATDHEMVVPLLLNMTTFYSGALKEEKIDFIEAKLQQLGNKEFLASFYDSLLVYFQEHCIFTKAIEYGDKALKAAQGTDHLGLTYNNLGALYEELNSNLAWEYFQKAKTLMSNDIGVLSAIWVMSKFCDYEEAIKCANDFSGDHRAVMKLRTELRYNKITPEAASKKASGIKHPDLNNPFYAADYNLLMHKIEVEKVKAPLFHSSKNEQEHAASDDIVVGAGDNKVSHTTRSGQADKTQKFLQKAIEIKGSRPKDIVKGITSFLSMCVETNKIEEGIAFLKTKKAEYDFLNENLSIPSLKYYEFILYERSSEGYDQATLALEALRSMGGAGWYFDKLLINANLVRFCTEVERKDVDGIRAAAKFTPYNDNFVEAIITIIQSDATKVLEDSAAIDTNTELLDATIDIAAVSAPEAPAQDDSSVSAASAATPTSDDAFEFFAKMSGKEIHQHFQRKKAQLAQTIDKIMEIERPTSWDLGAVKHNSKEDDIYKIEGLDNFYGYIDNKLKIDHELFVRAIKKGIVSKQYKSIGVKYFDGFFELKINGDPRVWADDNVYVNTEGKCLLLFNDNGRHKAATKAARGDAHIRHNVDIDKAWDFTKQVEVKQKFVDGSNGVKIDEDDLSAAELEHSSPADLPHLVTAGNVDHLHD